MSMTSVDPQASTPDTTRDVEFQWRERQGYIAGVIGSMRLDREIAITGIL